MTTETEKFLAWHKREQENGLVDIKFFTGDLSSVTSESFFSEANQMSGTEPLVSERYVDNVERTDAAELFGAADRN